MKVIYRYYIRNQSTQLYSLQYNLLYVGRTVTFRTMWPPFLYLGKVMSKHSSPCLVIAWALFAFSLKWSAASCNLEVSKCYVYYTHWGQALIATDYLHNIPWYENATDFGAKWMITLWNDSSEEVWCTGDSRAMSLHSIVLVIKVVILLLALVPAREGKNAENINGINLRLAYGI